MHLNIFWPENQIQRFRRGPESYIENGILRLTERVGQRAKNSERHGRRSRFGSSNLLARPAEQINNKPLIIFRVVLILWDNAASEGPHLEVAGEFTVPDCYLCPANFRCPHTILKLYGFRISCKRIKGAVCRWDCAVHNFLHGFRREPVRLHQQNQGARVHLPSLSPKSDYHRHYYRPPLRRRQSLTCCYQFNDHF